MRTDGRIENLSEQELDAYTEQLIRQAEAEGLIPAPAHMKQEILERSRSLDYQLRVQTRQIPKKLQFLYYSLKVGDQARGPMVAERGDGGPERRLKRLLHRAVPGDDGAERDTGYEQYRRNYGAAGGVSWQ